MEVDGEEQVEDTDVTNQTEAGVEPKRKRGRPSTANSNVGGVAQKKAFPIIPKNPGAKKVENPNEPMYLPRSTISKIVKRKLPAEARIGKNESLVLQKAATVFIMYLTHFATDILKKEGKQTLSGKQILEALETIEFRQFIATLTKEIQTKLTSPKKSKPTKKLSNNNDNNEDAIVVEGEEADEADGDDVEGEEEEEEDEADEDEDEEEQDDGDEGEVDNEDESDDMDEEVTRKKLVGKRKT